MIRGPANVDDYMHVPKEKPLAEEMRDIMAGASLVEHDDASPKMGKKSKVPRHFRSTNPRLRLQMMTTKPRLSPEGYWMEGESRFIQFRPLNAGGGFYNTSDIEEICCIEECSGYGVSIYDLDAMNVRQEEARMHAVEEMVAKDGKLLERLKARFGAKDFTDEPEEFEPKRKAK